MTSNYVKKKNNNNILKRILTVNLFNAYKL